MVVVGAHLDSVIAGPGINDNGSGTSTILEIAEEMAELGIRNRQKLRFVYDGDGAAGNPVGPPGSAQIEDVFTNYFASQRLASEPTPFNGRSDYGPFIAVGIPAGVACSAAPRHQDAGAAGHLRRHRRRPYDPYDHQPCDTINNLCTKALVELGDAAAHATMTLARSRTGFFEDSSFRTAARAAASARRPSVSSQAAA